jgi:hypothetical protein
MTVSAIRTIVVGGAAAPAWSQYNVPAYPQVLRWPVAEPDEVLDYSLDVSSLLSDVGDTIASATLAVSPSGAGELVASALSVLGGVITGWLGGGVAGRRYVVRIQAVTNGARSFSRLVGLPIDPTLATCPLPAAPDLDFGPVITWNPGAIVTGQPMRLVDAGLVATGVDPSTALLLGALTNVFTGAGGRGGILPDTVVSGTISVLNADPTNTDLLIYPPAGAAIGSGAVNAPVIVSPNQRVSFVTQSPATQWFAA